MQEKISALLSQLTLEEKASLCSGKDFWTTKAIDRLAIPSVAFADGPHGLRKENDEDESVGLKLSYPATAFPPAVNLASSWDTTLAERMGDSLGKQCKNQHVSVILGPGTNIKRSPLCGRNFEYFSEDPCLAGAMSVAYINGVQRNNAGTSLKHFCANNQERLRMTIDSIVDERALREIYLTAFEDAVTKAHPWTVMCSYNKLDGIQLSDNKRMLTDVLRDEWGFDGLVVSDWNAVHDRVEGIKAGMDLEMPSSGGSNDKRIVSAVKSGLITEDDLDKVVARVLEFVFRANASYVDDFDFDYEDAHVLAREIAEKSMVLLKNEGAVLPLADDDEKICVIGELARSSRYQGTGSSRINPYKLTNFLDALILNGKSLEFFPAYTLADDSAADEALLAQAVHAAQTHKKVVVYIGLTDSFESEGYDRHHFELPKSHDRLIQAVSRVNPDAVFVLVGGSPVAMPWIGDVKALLNAYLPGEAGGEAVYNVLFGKANPSGKLAETYPLSVEDNISSQYFPMGPKHVEYRESVYVGYRYFDSARKDVLFPFGYGLSYTTFAYSDLKVDGMNVSFTITNTGQRDGAEVCQLYVRDCTPAVFRPDKELRRFAKVFLKAGESATVKFTLDYRCFAFYNTATHGWYAPNGQYDVLIGASSRDIRLEGTTKLKLKDNDLPVPDYKNLCPAYYQMDTVSSIPQTDWEALYGAPMPANLPSQRGEFNYNTTISELGCCLVGKIIIKVAPWVIKTQVPNADMTTMLMMTQGMKEMPLRALGGITSGLLDNTIIDGMLLWGNKHRLKGLGKLVVGLFCSLGNIIRKDENNKRRREERKLQKLAEKEQAKEEKTQLKEQKTEEKVQAKEEKTQLKEQKTEEKAQAKEEKTQLKEQKAGEKTKTKDAKTPSNPQKDGDKNSRTE